MTFSFVLGIFFRNIDKEGQGSLCLRDSITKKRFSQINIVSLPPCKKKSKMISVYKGQHKKTKLERENYCVFIPSMTAICYPKGI